MFTYIEYEGLQAKSKMVWRELFIMICQPCPPYRPLSSPTSVFCPSLLLSFVLLKSSLFFRLILMSFSNIIQMFECFMQKSVLFFPLLSFVSNTVFLLYLSLKKLLVTSHDMIFPSSIVLHMPIVIYSTVVLLLIYFVFLS